ncbi:hypothetical protein L7F22_042394 [Adiantum nelumboides]|nr:hypothetical protein [Adiantum nelumboides]
MSNSFFLASRFAQDFTPGKEYIFVVDVDPQSFKVDPCKELLSSAKTIFMNAGMGSMPHFWHGTSKMDEVIDQNIATQKFFGGGDTLQEFKRWTQGMDLNGLEGGTAVTARFPRLLSEFAPHVNEIGRCMSFVVRDAVIPDDEDRTISIRMVLYPSLAKNPPQFISLPTIHGGEILQRVFFIGLSGHCFVCGRKVHVATTCTRHRISPDQR